VCYWLSSLLFYPIFLSAVPENASLNLITYHSGNRARLNERPIVVACYLTSSAVWATIVHLYRDVDKLDLAKSKHGQSIKGSGDAAGSLAMVWRELPNVLSTAFTRGLAVALSSLIVYPIFQRGFAWGWALFFLRPFYNLPKTNMVPPSYPFDLSLLIRCAYAGFLLSLIWLFGNLAFSIFMVKEPLKNGKPLTSESKDPNGSLLNGLKSKKASVQVSFQRLAILAHLITKAVFCGLGARIHRARLRNEEEGNIRGH
jgi:nucleoporin NDC1